MTDTSTPTWQEAYVASLYEDEPDYSMAEEILKIARSSGSSQKEIRKAIEQIQDLLDEVREDGRKGCCDDR